MKNLGWDIQIEADSYGVGIAEFRKYTGFSQVGFSKVLIENGMREKASIATIKRYEKNGFTTSTDGLIWWKIVLGCMHEIVRERGITVTYNGKLI